MAVADLSHGAEVFLLWFGLLWLSSLINAFSAMRFDVVFQRAAEVTKQAQPVQFGFLFGISAVLVLAGMAAIIMAVLMRSI